jgi:hypothetical protein
MLSRTTAVALFALGLAAPAYGGTIFTFDPKGAGLPGGAFTADALTGSDVSAVVSGPLNPDGSFTWHEHGFIHITGATLGGASIATPGLSSAYSLYMAYDINGFQPNLEASGYATSVAMEVFGVAGASDFSIDMSTLTAEVANGRGRAGAPCRAHCNLPVELATLSNASMTDLPTVENLQPLEISLSATLAAGYDLTAAGLAAFSFPDSPVAVDGEFSDPSSAVDVLFGGGVFLVQGGHDVLTFAVPDYAAGLALRTPELSTWAMMLIGFAGLGFAGHRTSRPGPLTTLASYKGDGAPHPLNHLTIRRVASSISAGSRAKQRRKKPSPPGPKAEPGAAPTPASSMSLSASARESGKPSTAQKR